MTRSTPPESPPMDALASTPCFTADVTGERAAEQNAQSPTVPHEHEQESEVERAVRLGLLPAAAEADRLRAIEDLEELRVAVANSDPELRCPDCGQQVLRSEACWVEPGTRVRHHDPCWQTFPVLSTAQLTAADAARTGSLSPSERLLRLLAPAPGPPSPWGPSGPRRAAESGVSDDRPAPEAS